MLKTRPTFRKRRAEAASETPICAAERLCEPKAGIRRAFAAPQSRIVLPRLRRYSSPASRNTVGEPHAAQKAASDRFTFEQPLCKGVLFFVHRLTSGAPHRTQ